MTPRSLFIVCLTACLGLSGCATVVTPPSAPKATAAQADAAWSHVLQRFVDERGDVDFTALAQDRADLDRYARFVADTPLTGFSDDHQRLAHMINAYNALSMFNVLQSGTPATHAG